MRLSVYIFSIFSLFLFQESIGASGETFYYERNTYSLGLDTRYFQSSSNFNRSGGTFESLPTGNSFTLFQFDLRSRYEGSSLWAVTAATQIAASESRSTTATRKNSGITWLKLGLDFSPYATRRFALVTQIELLQSLVRNSVESDNVALSDGSSNYGATLQAQWIWPSFSAGSYLGYTYRDAGKSALMPYGIFGEYSVSAMELGVRLAGFKSVSKDKDSNNETARVLYTAKANAGSNMFNAINPEALALETWITFNTTQQLQYTLGFGYALNGANSAAGWNLRISIDFLSQMKSSRTAPPQTDNFREKTQDGVDQTLFEPKPGENKKDESLDNTEGTDKKSPVKIQLKPAKKKGLNQRSRRSQ
jgi:hypothetical protein